MQKKRVTKKTKRIKVIDSRRGNKKQRFGNINPAPRKPARESIKKNTISSMSDCLTTLYAEIDYTRLNNIYELFESKFNIDNIFWILMNNKNKKFLSYLFNKYGGQFQMKQLGQLRNNPNISLKMIMQQAKRRMSI